MAGAARAPGLIDDRRRPATGRLALAGLAALTSACKLPPLPEIPDAAGEVPPGLTVQVAPTGDDASDGTARPVKTLGRAIAIAAGNPEIKGIVLAAGRYTSAAGEVFPYTVPANVTVRGAVGGGTVLAGTGSQAGLSVDLGALQDLELESFSVAIRATATASIKATRVRASAIAVNAATTARLTIDGLDVTGTAGACAKGLVLIGAASLIASTVTTRGLGIALDARDQSTSSLAKANVTGDPACRSGVMSISTTASFTLTDSVLDGGDTGIALSPAGAATLKATVTATSVRNFASNGIIASAATLVMTGGDISRNGGDGANLGGGNWTFTNVTIQQNQGFGIITEASTAAAPGTLKLRGAIVNQGTDGIYLTEWTTADLGTAASPGNNQLVSTTGVALNLAGPGSPKRINAVGNTWRPNTQNADASGHYPSLPGAILGPIAAQAANNYAIASGYSLVLSP